MFFEEGWAPLGEVTAEVFRRLQAIQVAGELAEGQGGLKTVLAISVWDILDASSKIGATGPDGSVIEASKDLVAWADPRALTNEHVDLMVGSIGSSTLPNADGKMPTQGEMALRYGPFLSLPVVIPINNYQSSLTFLDDEVKNFNPKDEGLLRAAKTIVEMVDSGALVTRQIARTKLGAALSRRKFKSAWAMAAGHRKELAVPNRWIGL